MHIEKNRNVSMHISERMEEPEMDANNSSLSTRIEGHKYKGWKKSMGLQKYSFREENVRKRSVQKWDCGSKIRWETKENEKIFANEQQARVNQWMT